VDPEAGKGSPWRRGVVREHQVLICPACQPSALADLTRCSRCGSAHLIRRLDQVECLDCRLVRDAESECADAPATAPSGATSGATSDPADPAEAVPRQSAALGSGGPGGGSAAGSGGGSGGGSAPGPGGGDLAAEVARALDRLRGNR
jgi:hypothetical protein